MYIETSKMPPPLFLLPLLLLPLTTSTSSLLSTLTHLQSTSPSGVIPLSTPLLNQILSLPLPRPFHFIVFFDAKSFHQKTELQLPTLLSEFSLVSKSYLLNSQSKNTIFFFHAEFKNSQDMFTLFGVASLPNVKLVPPTILKKDLENGSVKMEHADYARLADSMKEFIETKAGIDVGEIHRPPLVSKTQMWVVFVMVLASTPVLIKKVLKGDTLLHNKFCWLVGATFVYFVSVSGAMHNIIRKTPMFMRDSNTRTVYFYKGSGTQLGVEGFIVGLLYTVVGLLTAFMTHVLDRVNEIMVQRFVMIGALFVAFWAVATVISLDNWKTGYAIHAYWPTSWR